MSKLDQLINWRIDKKPPLMTKKINFKTYEQTRSFVNDLADLSEKTGYYPNLTFSKTQATVSIYTDQEEFGENEYEFAHQTDKIADLYREQENQSND